MTEIKRSSNFEWQRADNATHCARSVIATYWESNGHDGFGQTTVADPIHIRVRVEKALVESLQSNGQPIAVPISLQVDRRLVIGSIIWIGVIDYFIPPTANFYQIHEYEEVPDLKHREFDRWVKCLKFKNTLPTIISNRVKPI